MFDIEYKGGNTVVISTKKTTLITDPKLSLVGLKDMPTKDAVVLATEARFATNKPEARLTIEGPGEYEVGEFSIRGAAALRHIDTESSELISTIYRVEVGDTRIGIIGNIASKLSEDQLEELGVLDILVLPVGGNGYTLDATSAAAIVRQVDPKVIIPVHYADDALKYEVPQDVLDTFVTELAAPVDTETGSKCKIKSASQLPQTLTIVPITRS